MALDLTFITPRLAVGGRVAPEDLPALVALGIRHVVDVRVEMVDDEALLLSHGITLLHLPTMDRAAVSQEMLDDGARWVAAQVSAGERVLVHCQHGIGRSALVALCALVELGHAPAAALRLAKDARKVISPSPEQLEAFRERCRRRGVQAPELEELMSVAYRHLAGRTGTGGPQELPADGGAPERAGAGASRRKPAARRTRRSGR